MRGLVFCFIISCLIGGFAGILHGQDITQQAYLKASNAGSGDEFATALSLSGDTLVVGAPAEDSAGVEGDNSATSAGAVYVFVRTGTSWTQQAYLKASNAEAGDRFGQSVGISGDTLIVGANGEDGVANSASGSGAAYIFTRTGGTWTEQAYLKATNAEAGDSFGSSVAIAGETVVIGAISEDSDGTATNNNALGSGAAYVFTRSSGAWTQQAYLKASTPRASDQFGISVSLSGESLVIGANQEDGSASNSGAAYVFTRTAGVWAQEAYLKASNAGASDQFGFAVSIAGDLIAVSAPQEASNATGIDGNQANNNLAGAGAVYLFRRDAVAWSQEAYVKASNTAASDTFGQSIALRGDVLVVGAMGEDSNATGLNGSQINNIATNSGAAYVFEKLEGSWSQQAYLKASNTEASDQFGRSITLSGRTAVVGANLEDSSAGAAYAFIDVGTPGAEPELDVEQPLGSLLADEGSVVDYGLVAVGAPAVTKTFTLFNRGTADLVISSVTAGGDFIVNTSGMTGIVAAGDSTSFSVSFTPAASGQSNATLIISSNDSDESPYEITLTGAALPEIAITGNAVNIVSGDTLPSSADHTDFGIAEIAGGTRIRSFRITNTGVANLTLGTITISGDFTVTSPPVSPVLPGEFTTFEVTFDPSMIGLRSGTVTVPNNDGNESNFSFAIQGLGTGPGLTDTTFGGDGRVIADFSGRDERARSLAIQSDGKIVVAGYADNGFDTDIAVARYLNDGSLDPNFGAAGLVTTPIGSSFDEATGIALQSDGKIVVCGFAYNGSNDDFVVLRYLADGTLDSAFGNGGIVTTTLGSSDERAFGVAVQSNGRIVLVGSAYIGGNADVALVRYLPNGSLDASFGAGGKITTALGVGDDLGYALALQRDGKIVVTGQSDNGFADDLILLRYTANGSLDSSFGSGGKVVTPSGISNSAGFSVAVRRNGQIIVGGYTTNPTDTDWLIARYSSQGILDSSFGADGQVIAAVGSSYEEINSVVVQADGSVIAAGFTRVGTTDDIALMRFLPDGSVDSSFGDAGKVITALGTAGDYAFALGVQTDGRIVVTGHSNNGNDDDIALVRYVASPLVLPPQIIVEDAANLELPGGSSIDFGSVLVGDTSSVVIVGIVNDGTQPLNLSAIRKVGSFANDYIVDMGGMSSTLGAGASTSFTVRFSPSALGSRGITLSIESNDSDEPLYSLQLTGVGLATAPEITLLGDTDFTSVTIGNSVTHTLTISNEGTAPLLLPAGIIIEGGGSAFSVSRQPALTSVLVNGTVDFDVTFTPNGSGLRQAQILIANNDSNENPTRLAIEGVGIGAPEIVVESMEDEVLSSGVTSVDFGRVTVGTGLSSRSFTLRNVGTEDLVISNVSLSGGNMGDFELSTTSMASVIVPGGFTTFTVSFFTSALGMRSTTLSISNNDADESPFMIPLTGVGVAAEPVIVLSGLGQNITNGDDSPSADDGTLFGSVDLGDSVTRTFTITNSGTADLHLTGAVPDFISISGGDFFVSQAPEAGFIEPGQSLTFELTFIPTSTGPRTGIVSIANDDSDRSPFVFHLGGTGVGSPELDVEQPQGDLVVDEASVVDYGLVAVGAPPVTKTFTLFNRGTADLVITSATAGGDFIINTTGMATTVAVGESTNLTVHFTPSISGLRNATLIIISNDSDESPYEIELVGAALPEIAVTGNGVNIADGDTLPATADQTDFGIAQIAGGSTRRTFRVTNTGVADLTLGNIIVTGDFTVSSAPASSVAPGAFTTFEITFDPTLIGLRRGEVSFTNNDGNESPFNFSIQGLGTGPGLEDTTFGVNGRVITNLNGEDERARGLVFQSDGKILVAGYANNGLDTDIAVWRYLSSGSWDSSFGTNGVVMTAVGDSFDEATGIALQSDGKIIVCGFAYNGSNDDFVVLRYLTDGSLDSSFGGDGIVTTALGGSDDRAYGVALQSDGRIVLGGSAHNGSNADVALVRYLTDGSLDGSFGSGGKVTTAVGGGDDLGYALALQRDGRILVTGQSDNRLNDDLILLRYLPSGLLDSSFGMAGKVVTATGISNSAGFSVAVRRNGQILVGGYSTNPRDTDWLIARYTSNGSLDPTFGLSGKVIAAVGSSYEEINSIVVQPDGGVIAAGFTQVGTTDDIALMRFLPSGSVDSSFGNNGKVITALGSGGDYAFAAGVQTDGRIVVTGHTYNGNDDDVALVRYDAKLVVLPPKIIVENADYREVAGGSLIDFGPVLVGEVSSAMIVGIVNDGTEPLNLSAITLDGTNISDYAVNLSSTNLVLGAGESTRLSLVFVPTGLGMRTARLLITSNDADVMIFELQLRGKGTIPVQSEIAETGDWLDATNNFPVQGSLYRPMPGVINQDGFISFKAMGSVGEGGITAGNDSLLLTNYSLAGLQVIAQEGMWLPESGVISGSFNNLILTAAGRTTSTELFVGAVTDKDRGYLVSADAGTIELLSREGDTATGGGIFTGHTNIHAADDSERIYFPGTLSGVATTNNSGVWYDEAGVVSIFAKEGQNVSHLTADLSWLGNFSVPLSAAGDGAAFFAALQNNPSNATQKTPVALNAGIFSGAPGGLQLVARKGDAIPAVGKLGTFSAVARSTTGDHAFIALMGLSTVAPLVSTANDQVLMAEIGGGKHLVARENTTILFAGLKPVRFGNFYITETGEVIYQVWLAGAGVTTSNDSALCRWTVARGHELLAREGSLAPGTGLNYGTFQVFSVSSGGAVVLQSTLSSGIALMRGLPGAGLSEAVRTGTIISLNGVNRGILSLGIHQTGAGSGGGGGGMGAAINDEGAIFTVLSIGNGEYLARVYRP